MAPTQQAPTATTQQLHHHTGRHGRHDASLQLPAFCAVADPRPRLGALGILSATEHSKFRRAARLTWMAQSERESREAAGGLACRFVLRGLNASAALLQEAARHRDVLLVAAPALSRQTGPLTSLMYWYECALVAWPKAGLIGKADDDVYLHLPGIEVHLRLTLAATRNRSSPSARPPLLSWGVHETYHWDVTSHLPTQFAYLWGWSPADEAKDCARGGALIGPFHFAKGPLFFLSAALVRQAILSREVRRLARAAIDAADRGSSSDGMMPYEDVFAGLALALAASAPQEIYAVHTGDTAGGGGVFTEPQSQANPGDYLALAPATLFYHEKYKHHERIAAAHSWLRQHHCDARRVELACADRAYVGCSGAKWRRCVATARPHVEAGCATQVVRLSGGFSADGALADATPDCARRVRSEQASTTTKARRPGTCGVTEFGTSDCGSGDQGAWVHRGSLAECVQRCVCCARCRYVSYSKIHSDCSWFHECDVDGLLRAGEAAEFHTVAVDWERG